MRKRTTDVQGFGTVRTAPKFSPYATAMKRVVAKVGVDELCSSYAKAVVAFNVASASLIVSLAANSRPTDEQIAAEEGARAAVVAARRTVWAAYGKSLDAKPWARPFAPTQRDRRQHRRAAR